MPGRGLAGSSHAQNGGTVAGAMAPQKSSTAK